MLGIEVKHDCEACMIHLSQWAYIDCILCHFNLNGLKSLSTPMDTQVHLCSEQAPIMLAKFMIMCDVPYLVINRGISNPWGLRVG
jgi:hypothetical protein